MEEDILPWGFDALPKEIRQLIFSFSDLDLVTVLRVQAVSSEFKKLSWSWMREYDTSLLSNKEGVAALVIQCIDRLTPGLITRIDFTRFDKVEEVASDIVQKFPHLQRIRFGNDVNVSSLRFQFESHPELYEISSELYGVYEKADPEDGFQRDYSYEHHINQGPFYQEPRKEFNRYYHRGGMVGAKLVVIGAADGTLTFLTLDDTTPERKLDVCSTKYGIHKSSVTSIWCEPNFDGVISACYIASHDGIISSWRSNDEGAPELKQTFTLPESIFFVCDFPPHYLLAAGKRTLYICNTHSAKIARTIAFGEDITGLFHNVREIILSTISTFYTVDEDVASLDPVHKVEAKCDSVPNMWLSPDISLRMTVRPNKIDLLVYEMEGKEHHEDFGADSYKNTYDPRPHLARFSPNRYWMTASTGPEIVTYDLETRMQIGSLSLPVSNRAKYLKLIPQCNALWYSPCGNYLFGLFSNSTLYWWRVGY